ncbi:MAG TPA: excinuclease ABC subunit UvrB, partial [Planctomycetota bacterium]|nr:excinuclease ABC subunit UvrB [Planctomycetota bacterium]
RLAATSALQSRRDVIIVASVSCIYGLGDPKDYTSMIVPIELGGRVDRDDLLRRLVSIQYERKEIELVRGTFRVRGDVVEIFPAYEEIAYRVELFGDEVEAITEIDPLTGQKRLEYEKITIYPAKHFVLGRDKIERAVHSIQAELRARIAELEREGKMLEAERLNTRTRYDCELLLEIGYCPGIENYSRHFTGRKPGERPYNLLDYFPDDFLVVVDESHVTIPQIGGMYNGDRSRKETLVKHGFRLPSALDNRPMRFDEWEEVVKRAIFVSATPGDYELHKTGGEIVELINRPTGLLDPEIEVRPATGQVPDLIEQCRQTIEQGDRVLVATLTKRMAEDLQEHLQEKGFRSQYLHSEVQTIDRVEVLQDLRRGTYDVVVGVNLLREGLDLPEVSLMAILDADKEGFLRSETSLIQMIGRAARNERARVILYADDVTDSMRRAIEETERRRAVQEEFNREHGIVPKSVEKGILPGIERQVKAHTVVRSVIGEEADAFELREKIAELEREMLEAADRLDFERAAELRDAIAHLEESAGTERLEPPSPRGKPGRGGRRGPRGSSRRAAR